MNKLSLNSLVSVSMLSVLAVGCAAGDPEDEPVAQTESALTGSCNMSYSRASGFLVGASSGSATATLGRTNSPFGFQLDAVTLSMVGGGESNDITVEVIDSSNNVVWSSNFEIGKQTTRRNIFNVGLATKIKFKAAWDRSGESDPTDSCTIHL